MTDYTPEQLAERRANRTRLSTAGSPPEPVPVPMSERRHDRGFPVRNVRMPDDEWQRVRDAAELDGTTASALVRNALDAYLDRRP